MSAVFNSFTTKYEECIVQISNCTFSSRRENKPSRSNMYWRLLIATCLVALGSAAPDSPRLIFGDMKLKLHSSKHLEEEWQNFKINHNRAYNDAKEEIFRKKIFAEHLEAIEAHNRLYSEGLKTFTMGINQFADLESSEFIKRMNGYRPRNASEEPPSASFFEPEIDVSSLPLEVDWRRKGYVTPVKDQTPYCGSCWAFSAIGALEGQHFRKKGKLVSLSEQQLIDCSKEDNGCCGGWPYRALSYIALNGGIDTEESYPYENKNGPCRYNQSNVGATCNDYAYIRKTEWALQVAVAAVGPISVAIEVLPSLQFYNGGVYDDPTCSGAKLNHAVLVVGYGKTDAGKKYWIVKNSWGSKWGNDGYIWMSKNKKNQCGITNVAVYPIV